MCFYSNRGFNSEDIDIQHSTITSILGELGGVGDSVLHFVLNFKIKLNTLRVYISHYLIQILLLFKVVYESFPIYAWPSLHILSNCKAESFYMYIVSLHVSVRDFPHL